MFDVFRHAKGPDALSVRRALESKASFDMYIFVFLGDALVCTAVLIFFLILLDLPKPFDGKKKVLLFLASPRIFQDS